MTFSRVHEIWGDVSSVELHSLDQLHLILQCLTILKLTTRHFSNIVTVTISL